MKQGRTVLGRLLLRLFPQGFRDRFGDELSDYLTTRTREIRARRGVRGVLRFWIRGLLDLLGAAMAERAEERADNRSGGNSSDKLFDLRSDIRFAVRTLRRTPAFTIAVFVTLALGIGATTAMFSVMETALGRSLPYPEADRLVLGRATFNGNVNPWASFPDYMDYRDQSRSLASLATIGGRSGTVTVTGGDEPDLAQITFVTRNLFETLGVRPAIGSTFSIEELPESGGGETVISHEYWLRHFSGDPDVMGRSLVADGTPMTVVGVMPGGFRFFYDVDLWVPPWPGNSDPVTRRYHNWLLVGRLAADYTLEAARSEIDIISARLQERYPDSNLNKALQLDELHGAMVEGQRESLLVLVGAIVLVLLIACGNVASLFLARGSTRTSELSVRAALGAGRMRLTRQLLVECLTLALAAGAMGVVLAVWFQNLILGYVSLDLLGVRERGPSFSMLGIALAVTLGTVMLFGVAPSLAAARTRPAEGLKEGGRGSSGGGGAGFRSGLVVLQVALSLVLLVGAGLLLRSFGQLRSIDPGFRVENLLTASVDLPADDYAESERRIQFFENLAESIRALPGVESVGLVSRLPILHPAGNMAIWAPERPPETNVQTPWADRRVILPGYFETMGIPLVEGRVLDETDVAGSRPVIVLSRTAAEAVFPDEPVLGRQVAVDMGNAEPGYFEVVGVVEDHQLSSLAGETRPAMFFPHAQLPVGSLRLAVASADPMALVRPIQERIWERDRDIVLTDAQTMEDAVSNSIADARSVTTVLGLFAGAALALAVLGLYGVLAFIVSRRVHEIAIRVTLGAAKGSVLRMIINQGMILVAGGVVLGIGGAVLATRRLEDMLFQTSTTDLFTFGGVTVVFVLVALGACFLPAWRALGVDPVEAFRAE